MRIAAAPMRSLNLKDARGFRVTELNVARELYNFSPDGVKIP